MVTKDFGIFFLRSKTYLWPTLFIKKRKNNAETIRVAIGWKFLQLQMINSRFLLFSKILIT